MAIFRIKRAARPQSTIENGGIQGSMHKLTLRGSTD